MSLVPLKCGFLNKALLGKLFFVTVGFGGRHKGATANSSLVNSAPANTANVRTVSLGEIDVRARKDGGGEASMGDG